MSRSAIYPFNGTDIGNRHKVVRYSIGEVTVYCPVAKDNVSGNSTSIGTQCSHCDKHF